MVPRLLERYRKSVRPEIIKKFNRKNIFEAPELKKIVINMGVGVASGDIKILDGAVHDLGLITGQKPVMTRSKKSISNFKIRKNQPIGCVVTLRGMRMYEFLDRLISVAIPRIKDFRGLNPNSFDEGGNYSFGLQEQTIFPEVDMDKVTSVRGMDIIMNIKSKSKEESFELLKQFGMPFRS